MSVAVLIPGATGVEACVSIGLDIAAHLDQPLLAICFRPGKPDDSETGSEGDSRDKSGNKAKSDTGPVSPPDELTLAPRTGYADAVRDCIHELMAGQHFGLPATDVVEVGGTLGEIRHWLKTPTETDTHQCSPADTLVIPVIRGADDEGYRGFAYRLFETSTCRTVLVSVAGDWSGRLPLESVYVVGESGRGFRTARDLATGLHAKTLVQPVAEDFQPDGHCLFIGIPGKAGYTSVDNSSHWGTWRRDARLPAVFLVNPADSWRERLATNIDERLRLWFADYQMTREKRIELSDKLERGARYSPEFVLFMAVATFLASIGLIQDSAAVIIGAMLVAPLMTPLLGAGLAMIYGNRPLFGRAARTILLGVAISLIMGGLVGLFSLALPDWLFSGTGLVLTNEMISRSQPNLMDPFIGLAAGLAGGFAIGRDGQLGTVAGVAIAAALVPPIATAGLELAIVVRACWLDGLVPAVTSLLGRDPTPALEAHGLIVEGHRPTTNVQLVFAPLMLFILNACATIIGAFAGMRIVGMHRSLRPRQSRAWVTAVFLGLLLAVVLFLMVLPFITLSR